MRCRAKVGPAVGSKEMKAEATSGAEFAIVDKFLDPEISLALHRVRTHDRKASLREGRFQVSVL